MQALPAIEALLDDPHVAPAFKRAFMSPHEFLFLNRRFEKQERRRFLAQPEPLTGFGELREPVVLSAESMAAMDETWTLADAQDASDAWAAEQERRLEADDSVAPV